MSPKSKPESESQGMAEGKPEKARPEKSEVKAEKARPEKAEGKGTKAKAEGKAEGRPEAKAGKGKAEAKAEAKAEPKSEPTPKIPARLRQKYLGEVVPALSKEFGYKNVMQVPHLKKVVLSIGMGESISNPKAMEAAEKDLSSISGQHPVTTRSKHSVAAFKLRAGMPIGLKVTLRADRMYHFLDKLFNVVLPRLRDFQGVSPSAFDGRGSYNLGLREQIVFPEIEYDKVDKLRGLEITIVTSAATDDEARRLLQLMGMPFRRN